ncbi:MAG TPA: CHAP domain-containing protein [Acetobacteraceae bacterium]|nr:CHAP domain-containing protein [Acetobacteraceae bacterium]
MKALIGLAVLLLLAGCGGSRLAGSGGGSAVECAPFARAATGILLYGDAASWWDQAEGRYPRSSQPVEGGVLVFRRSSRLPSGHVAVVDEQVSPREIRVTQANWVHRRVTRAEPVIDTSPENDWSQVRVWWEPAGSMGATTYPTYGFIAPNGRVAELETR